MAAGGGGQRPVSQASQGLRRKGGERGEQAHEEEPVGKSQIPTLAFEQASMPVEVSNRGLVQEPVIADDLERHPHVLPFFDPRGVSEERATFVYRHDLDICVEMDRSRGKGEPYAEAWACPLPAPEAKGVHYNLY